MEISKRVVRASISSQVHILVGFAGHTITIKISRSTFRRSYVVLLREPLFAQVFDRLSTHVWVRGGGGRGRSQRFKISALCAFPVLRSQRYKQKKSKAPVSQLVNVDDTSVIEIKTQLYLES